MRFYYEHKTQCDICFMNLSQKNSIKTDCFPKSLFHFDIFFLFINAITFQSPHFIKPKWVVFVCLVFFRPILEFSTQYETATLPVEGYFFYLCSALMVIEQLGIITFPHLLWHGRTLFNGHLRRAMTLEPVAKCLATDLSLPVLTNLVCPNLGIQFRSEAMLIITKNDWKQNHNFYLWYVVST